MAAPGFGGFGGGAPDALGIGAGISAGGGAPATLGTPGGGFAGGGGATGGSPANLMPFQVVAYLREPIAPPAPPGSVPGLNIGGGGGLPTLGGFGGGPAAPPSALGGRGMGI